MPKNPPGGNFFPASVWIFGHKILPRPAGGGGRGGGKGRAVTQHEMPNSVSTASWDLKIGERVNDTLRMSQKNFQVMVVRTFREKRKKLQNMRNISDMRKPLECLILKAD